ncbi:MAG: nitrous oxide-stimulated promoter family protein [Arcobacteraceae bacterium]
MTEEKFASEVETLKKFFEIHCEKKHNPRLKYTKVLPYKTLQYDVELKLCEACYTLINYSFERLNECPHEIKPKCRSCKNPCYEKTKYKEVAKIMKFSGIYLGISKIKKFFS